MSTIQQYAAVCAGMWSCRAAMAIEPFLVLGIGALLCSQNSAALALWGFGSQSEETAARTRAVEMVRASAAADEYVPPAFGVRRDQAGRYTEAKSLGGLSCGESTVPWARVNDDFCDCVDGSDEPGTSACSTGEHTRCLLR